MTAVLYRLANWLAGQRLNFSTRRAAAKRAWSGPITQPKDDRRRLLILANEPGWAFDELAQQRQRHLADSWEVDILYLSEKPQVDPSRYDLLFNPNWGYGEYDRLFHGRYIRGFFSQKWQRGPMPYRTLQASLRGAVACFVPDKHSLTKIRKVFPPVFLVKEGIDPSIFHWLCDRTGEDLVVGWTGQIKNPNKRFETVVQPACEEAGVELRTASSLPRDQLNLFYNDVDLVLIGSEPLQEGNPLALYEAGACGRTVLATHVGCVPEIVEDRVNGLIVEATFDTEKTIRTLVERLKWCKANVSEVRAMGKRHRERVLAERTPQKTCETFRQALERAYAHRLC